MKYLGKAFDIFTSKNTFVILMIASAFISDNPIADAVYTVGAGILLFIPDKTE